MSIKNGLDLHFLKRKVDQGDYRAFDFQGRARLLKSNQKVKLAVYLSDQERKKLMLEWGAIPANICKLEVRPVR